MPKRNYTGEFSFSCKKTDAEQKRQWREKTAKRRASRATKGLCTYCGGEREDKDYQLCSKCRERKVSTDKENIRRGLCRNCGGEKEDNNVNHCNRCREAQRRTSLKKNFGITADEYDRMLNEQGGVCHICRCEDKTRLHVDHDHVSGKVRGLLCGNCNRGIGVFQDSPKLLREAADYLERC